MKSLKKWFRLNRKKIAGVAVTLLTASFAEALNGNVGAMVMAVLMLVVLILTW